MRGRGSFRFGVVIAALAAAVCTAAASSSSYGAITGAQGSAQAAKTPASSLIGLGAKVMFAASSADGQASFGSCGSDSSVVGVAGAQSETTIQNTSPTAGWTAVDGAFSHTMLGWANANAVGVVSQLRWLYVVVTLRSSTGQTMTVSVLSGGGCPAALATESSPLGEAFPITWQANSASVGDTGCGYALVAGSPPSGSTPFAVTFLFTDGISRGISGNFKPSCSGGKMTNVPVVVPAAPKPHLKPLCKKRQRSTPSHPCRKR
jgi:hypothetical protein